MMKRLWILTGLVVLAVALALAGCAKKEPAATAGTPSDSALAQQNAQAPAGGAADTSGKMSERERGGQPLPGNAPPGEKPKARQAASGKSEAGRTAAKKPQAAVPAAPKVTYATLPAGQSGDMTLTTALSSETSNVGDNFTAELATAWTVDGRVILPASTRVLGHVAYAEASKRGKAKAKLILAYDKLGLNSGQTVDIDAKADTFEAAGTTTRDVATVGAGALIGGILGKLSGNTKKGVAIGAVAGGGAALAQRGKSMELPAGQKLTLHLQSSVQVPVRRTGT